MTDSPPKRASWRLQIALVVVGIFALGGGALLALEHVSRKERELAAVQRASRRARELAQRLEIKGGFPEVDAVVASLERGEVDEAAFARLGASRDVLDAALVRLATDKGAETVVRIREAKGELAAAFEHAGPEPGTHHEIFAALGDLQGVARRGVVVPSKAGVRVERDAVHVPVVAAVYVASPSPVLIVVVLALSEPVIDVIAYLQATLAGRHEGDR